MKQTSQIIEKFIQDISIIHILIIGFLFRIINLNQSLWFDEGINIVYARDNSFWWFILKYPIGDFHPPGYFALLWVTIRIFGDSEIAVRLLSIILGTATIYLTYLISKKLFSTKAAFIASLLLAISPLHIYYSQEARMYSFAGFAASFCIWALLKFIRMEKYSGFIFSLSVTLLLFSDYLTYFLIPALFIYVYLFNRKLISKFSIYLLLGLILFTPWLPIFWQQLEHGRQTASQISGWREVVGGANLKELLLLPAKLLIGKISFVNKFIYAIILMITAIPSLYLLFISLRKIRRESYLLIFWLLIPAAVAFIVSFWIPIFAYFRFIFIMPAFYILIAQGFVGSKNYIYKISLLIFIILQLLFSFEYLTNSTFHREDWKGATSFINSQNMESTVVLFEGDTIHAPFTYYSTDLIHSYPGLKKVPAEGLNDVVAIDSKWDYKNIYVFEYLVDVTDPQRFLEQKLKNSGYKNIKTENFRGVGFINIYKKTTH